MCDDYVHQNSHWGPPLKVSLRRLVLPSSIAVQSSVLLIIHCSSPGADPGFVEGGFFLCVIVRSVSKFLETTPTFINYAHFNMQCSAAARALTTSRHNRLEVWCSLNRSGRTKSSQVKNGCTLCPNGTCHIIAFGILLPERGVRSSPTNPPWIRHCSLHRQLSRHSTNGQVHHYLIIMSNTWSKCTRFSPAPHLLS